MNRLLIQILYFVLLASPVTVCAKESAYVEFLGLAIPGSINYEFNLLHNWDWDLNQNIGVGLGPHVQLATTVVWFHGHHHLETGIATKLPWDGPAAMLPAASINIGYRYEKGIVFRIVPQIVYLIPYSDFPYGNRIIPWISVSVGGVFDGPFTWLQSKICKKR